MINPTFWNQFFIWPIVNLLLTFYKIAEALHLPGPLGFAIIGLTILIRIILFPLTRAQLLSAKKMAALKPHIDELNTKHKNDKPALQKAQMNLYKEHGVNPAAGCLPLLIQFPVLIALYNVFYQVFNSGDLPKIMEQLNHVAYNPALKLTSIDLNFFGLNLGIKPGQWQTYGIWLLIIPVTTAALQWYQTKLMLPPSTPKKPENKLVKAGDKDKKDEKPEDMAMEMQKQMGIIMPLMFGYFALQFPIGLALYWNVFGIFGIIQQLAMNRKPKTV